MTEAGQDWALVQIVRSVQTSYWPLKEGKTTLGRAADNPICLDDESVSRYHAEIVVAADGIITIREVKSRNGIKVNNMHRQQAILQANDKLRLGDIVLQLVNSSSNLVGAPIRNAGAVPEGSGKASQGNTIDPGTSQDITNGDPKLRTFIELCSLLTEGVETRDSIRSCLRLLRDAFSALEVHFYPATGKEEDFVFVADDAGAAENKPQVPRRPKASAVKVADFLADMFRKFPEATAVPGKRIGRHQARFNEFNFLVGPLITAQVEPGGSPYLVLLRPTDWAEFAPEDRGRLQLVCQIWTRGQARAVQVQSLRRENAHLKQRAGVPALLGSSKIIGTLRERALKAAAMNSTVFLTGENGSGKEVVAHFIQENSPRKDKPFVIVNISAIPEGMIESDLFGHGGASFTGASGKARRGKFMLADGGTIFLDEIGDLPYALQVKLLRTIENGEIQPLGSEETIKVNTRIIAATNRDLKEMVRAKQFREDLFYRLNTLPVRVPPLRDHLDDIDVLANHLLARYCAENNGLEAMEFTSEAIAELKGYDWPGNVRELYAVVQRCATFAAPPQITKEVVREALS